MAANITLIKFLGGEEILAEILSEEATSITVKNAVRIVVIPDQLNPKSPQVGLAPYLQFSETKELTFNRNLIVTTAAPLTEFVNQYNSLFGGIQLATSKIITP
jgi:hypothetical protein